MLQRKVSNSVPGEEESLLQVHSDDFADSDLEDFEIGLRAIPYANLIGQYLPFDDQSMKRLVPGCGLRLSIQDVYFKDKRYWYTIDIEHARFKWSVKKRFREILQLHHQLQMYRTLLTIQLPEIKFDKGPSNRRRSSVVFRNSKVPKLPTFPLTFDALSRNKEVTWKMAALESYLQNILNTPKFRNFRDTLEFLEIGPLSFVDELGPKSKEGFVFRRSNCPTSFGLCIHLCFCRSFPCWKKRWMFIKENFVGLVNPRSGQVECVLLLDRAFKVDVDRDKTRHSDGILIQNLNRCLYLKCDNKFQVESWAAEFNYIMNRGSRDFVYPNRYESYAPPRPLTECRWIVDGATYFEAVAEVLDKAKEEIYISDWWLSPEVYLKRPTVHGHYWQLDYVLKRKARSGVRIYVLLYKELELALGINSHHSQEKLSKMHKNIKVLRHPYVSKGVLLWAHHEKIVCVDQMYAFVGGLDLCYGRWDDYQHRLSDFGDFEEKLKIMRHKSTCVPETINKMKSTSSFPDLSSLSDLPLFVKKATSKPKTVKKRHLFKSAIKKQQATQMFSDIKRKLSIEAKMENLQSEFKSTPYEPADRRRTVQEVALMVLGIDRKYRLWHGKDYVNFINKDFQDLQQPYSDMIDRNTTPRMPWHDVGLFVQGKIARDIARHFILRWNHAKSEICPSDASYPHLMPKAYSDFGDNVPSFLHDTIGTIFRAECQVLRSLTYWSGQISETEKSIHNAYIDVILESKHFIYIENQFFISQPSGDRNVYNGIAEALFNRILIAHRSRMPFHVYVLLPLLPAFEGELGTGTGVCIQAITHWNYKSISRSRSSLLCRLSMHIRDPSKYISFYGLRTHGTLNNMLVSELVYVHSKMIIADDQVAIIGSANINDRSLLGRRDSEIAVLVKDTQFLDKEDGRPYQAGKFCHSLRTALFREHLGSMTCSQSSADLRDPSNERFFKGIWATTAINNTSIYEEVFRCLPTDQVMNFRQLKLYRAEPCLATTNPDLAKEKLKAVQGYLVMFPLRFLCEETLKPNLSVKEHYLPVSVWT